MRIFEPHAHMYARTTADYEAMARAGHFLGTRLPRLSDLARVLLEFEREVSVPNVPPFLVRGFLAPLAWLARRRVGGRG